MVEEWEGGYQDADLALALCGEDGERGQRKGSGPGGGCAGCTWEGWARGRRTWRWG